MTEQEQLLRQTYDAFNARDIESALAMMHPDVDWPNAMEGRREYGQAAVRQYWTRQFRIIDPYVEPLRFTQDEEGRIVVDIQQVVRDAVGKLIADQQVQHVFTLRDGLIKRMDVRASGNP
jgi:hypothetical protein